VFASYTSTVNAALSAFAAERRRLLRIAVLSAARLAANPPIAAAAVD